MLNKNNKLLDKKVMPTSLGKTTQKPYQKITWLSSTKTLALLCLIPATAWTAPLPGGSLNPTTIPKYNTSLYIPPIMPKVGTVSGADYYKIAARQISQQVLPKPMPKTTLWAYGSAN